ncbi:hypothetical protein [Arthrobacter sp. MYb213]|uniref:hypothetical protein n=1 Tax=Arthrobacter sp. MYb213 TaxID=1848595 RepID=UPI000CFB1BFB|nr:hypothetical protein [Arthrobacter sp. MYb213]PRB67144.1 hypothetical protein CQ011_16940 [Arthrobacter sp. MYb213]
MRKILAPISLAFLIFLVGCAGTASTAESSSETTSNNEVAQSVPADLTGDWKQTNSQSEDAYQVATVRDEVITIDWVTNNGDTKSTYWVGTFEAPTTLQEPYIWSSKRDKKATDTALLASTSDSKEFTFDNEQISYEAGILGTTTTVRLSKAP